MQMDSSASSTPSESRSASEWAMTVSMRISLQARMTRTAISPRLAMSTFLKTGMGSGHHHAAIDVEDLAGDVAGSVAGQEGNGLGNVFGGALATSRDQLQHGVDGGFGHALPDVGVDHPRGHGVTGDASGGDFARRGTGEADHAGLGGGVVGLPGVAHHARN